MADLLEAQKHISVGMALYRQGRLSEAAASFRLAIAADPESAQGHARLAWCIAGRESTAEAVDHLRIAVKFAPDAVNLLQSLSSLLKRSGEFGEAELHLRRAMELEPNNPVILSELLSCRHVGPDDRPLIERLATLADNPGIPLGKRKSISFSLGRAHERLDEYEAAMRYFDEANELGKQISGPVGKSFDPDAVMGLPDRLTDIFRDRPLEILRRSASESSLPVFVIGMIRSGTTLVDQILSSHPAIASAGEMTLWQRRLSPALFGQLYEDRGGAEQIAELSSDYRVQLITVGPGAARVTDKNPMNYLILGLLHLLYPNAHIVHIRRSPIDTCLSIYTTEFGGTPPDFAFDKRNIVTAYRQYQRLMELWRGFIPKDRMIEIDYEELVNDREPVIRSVLEFIGLPWDDACLRHESNPTPVVTPSVWQARQRIYTGSVDRWRRFEPWLGELGEVGKSVSR